MPTIFDPDAGLLRVSHGALSVLATLAVDPTAPSLTDHATAPPLAELRSAGIVGPSGIHAAVRPLAMAVGAPLVRFGLELAEPGGAWTAPGWMDADLVVVAVPTREEQATYDLVADSPAAVADLVGDLVGVAGGLPDPRTAERNGVEVDEALPASMPAVAFAALLAPDPGDRATLPHALSRFSSTLRARWRLSVHEGGSMEVIDVEASGMWLVRGPDVTGTVDLTPIEAAEVRVRLANLLRDP